MNDRQTRIGEVNAANGFHDEGDYHREAARAGRGPHAGANLRNYYAMKLALITSEVSEALEELRDGRGVAEVYYVSPPCGHSREVEVVRETQSTSADGCLRKPEGVPSELADVVIRAYDFAYEAGFDLDAIIEEKLAFNATRGVLHGRGF